MSNASREVRAGCESFCSSFIELPVELLRHLASCSRPIGAFMTDSFHAALMVLYYCMLLNFVS